jgi:hypothetical protein
MGLPSGTALWDCPLGLPFRITLWVKSVSYRDQSLKADFRY